MITTGGSAFFYQVGLNTKSRLILCLTLNPFQLFLFADSGAFFVNYIITAAMAGAALELIRFPELLWYAIQICWSKSIADTPAIRDKIKYEFRFGEQYAR